MQGARCRWGAKRVGNAVVIRRIVRKHDCALPAQHTKHSNARGVSLGLHIDLKGCRVVGLEDYTVIG